MTAGYAALCSKQSRLIKDRSKPFESCSIQLVVRAKSDPPALRLHPDNSTLSREAMRTLAMPSRMSIRLLAGVALLFRAQLASAQITSGVGACTTESWPRALGALRALIDTAGLPGAAIAIINRGNLARIEGFGYADSAGARKVDRNTVFEAASLSKPVVAYATLKLADLGRLNLDTPLNQYLAYPSLPKDVRAQLITARMVLSHTSGLQNERIGDDALKLSFAPGSKFQYSGEGYIYLGRAIEQIMQMPLAAAMDQLVFRPLGMGRSSFVWEKRFDNNAAVGHGSFGELRRPTRPSVARAPSSLHTTALDYGTFLLAILQGTGLKAQTSRAMISPAVNVAPAIEWGLGWGIEGGSAGPSLWHHGDNSNSGFTAFALVNVRRRCGLVYFANSVSGLSIAKEIAGLVSGTHPSIAWIGYESYAAPALGLRRKIGRTLRTSGATGAIVEYRQLENDRAPGISEGLLNSAGYLLLGRGDVAGAVLVFNENVRAYPSSGNVYDSLGDAYLAAHDDRAAIDAFARSALIDPTNSRARQLADSLRALIAK
jgi:CubicO group peptidase (beta-lactamase class C family)